MELFKGFFGCLVGFTVLSFVSSPVFASQKIGYIHVNISLSPCEQLLQLKMKDGFISRYSVGKTYPRLKIEFHSPELRSEAEFLNSFFSEFIADGVHGLKDELRYVEIFIDPSIGRLAVERIYNLGFEIVASNRRLRFPIGHKSKSHKDKESKILWKMLLDCQSSVLISLENEQQEAIVRYRRALTGFFDFSIIRKAVGKELEKNGISLGNARFRKVTNISPTVLLLSPNKRSKIFHSSGNLEFVLPVFQEKSEFDFETNQTLEF